MTLEDAKIYLRVDVDDDDDLIQALITAAESYLKEQTGKTKMVIDIDPETETLVTTDIRTSELWNLAVKLLVAHWYENRGVEIPGNLTKINHSVDALAHHIAMCGDYV